MISGDILDRRDGRILIFLNFFQVYEAYRMAAPSSNGLQVKSRATTTNSECRSLLRTFLVSCPVAFPDLSRSPAYLIHFY